jgi:hypothetical protein
MAMSVTVSLTLLEDIFRLLIYLDMVADRDELHFHKSGSGHRFERDTALWELKLKIKRLQSQIVETYLTTIDDITEGERHALRDWVADGNGVYDNPGYYCDEKGNPMDYISAMRVFDVQLAEMGLVQDCMADDELSRDEGLDLALGEVLTATTIVQKK